MSDATLVLPPPAETPLVELHPRPALPRGVRILAKLESVHPGGSIKDRSVRRILTGAIERGELNGGRRVLDSSSGNAGIAYAMLGAALGIDVTLVIPGNASLERLERIRAHGAEVILTDPLEGYDHAVREAARLGRGRPDRYWYANQYANDDNWRAHYETTGPEILRQVRRATGASPAAFVAGVGTGGTLTGVGRRLQEEAPGVHVLAIVPEVFPGIEGLKPLGSPGDFVPPILDTTVIDERLPVTTEQAVAACRWLAKSGLFCGPSSGAYVHAAVELARRGSFATVVTVLSDSGDRYGSTGMWGRTTERSETAKVAG